MTLEKSAPSIPDDTTLTHTWRFPLPRTHTGALLGNGTLGAMIWGEENILRITLGRADWWDRRGGKTWNDEMSFANIRRVLETGDEPNLRRIFSQEPASPGWPTRPSVLPVGRVELVFPGGVKLDFATLDMGRGELSVSAGRPLATLDLSPDAPVLRLLLAPGAPAPQARFVPAWHYVGDHLRSISFDEPVLREDGWTQSTPADATLTVACRPVAADEWRIAAVLDDEPESALAASFDGRAAWWERYWSRVPRIRVPNERWQFLYHYGLYKLAGLTAPQGVAATLQGPWIEEYQMPPWQSDYHFNMNAQMCYWPAYQAGLHDHLLPLFRMIDSWRPVMRENARKFAGIDDGYLLPHAVSDRCGIIGDFWPGTIDHACTAWVAKMMYDYYNYTGDVDFLRRSAWPLMVGAMRVYEAMMERGSGGVLSLPLSVSPEYRDRKMDAWGANASFQLAACHWLAEALETSARVLGERAPGFCRDIREHLKPASLATGPFGSEIALWDGLLPEESHRHFSHLGALWPFDTIDLADPEWAPVLMRSYDRWVCQGMGLWSSWSLPWASVLHARFGNRDMAEITIDIWSRLYTNEGEGTLYLAKSGGFSATGGPASHREQSKEIMQIEAGLGVTAAIMELLAHTRRGVVHLFSGAPSHWNECSFENIRVEGGFLIGARRVDGVVTAVRIEATRDGRIALADPWAASAGRPLVFDLRAGEVRELHPHAT